MAKAQTAPNTLARRLLEKRPSGVAIPIKFPADLDAWLRQMAAKTGTPVSRVVIEAVRKVREGEEIVSA